MCYTSDEIFDGGLSDERGTREYQRRHGYNVPPLTGLVGAPDLTQAPQGMPARVRASLPRPSPQEAEPSLA